MYDFSFHTKTQEPYSFLLERKEWKAKRDHILIRDGHCCQRCGAKEEEGISLHVHHKHYIYGLDPWEYKDTELTTLCEECHRFVHENGNVPVYRLHDGFLEEVTLTNCYRCSGAGYFREYRHVQGGVCFRCHGARFEEIIRVTQTYAKEHDIEISDIQAGFRPLSEESKKNIQSAVLAMGDSGKLYVSITMKNGILKRAFPDFSMEGESGDALVLDTLLWKTKQFRNSTNYYLIVKGKIQKPLVAV